MSKKQSSILQLALALTCVSVVATVALSGVYVVTKAPIEEMRIKKSSAAIIAVLPGFDINTGEFITTKVLLEGVHDSLTVSLAFANNELFGAAVETHTNLAFSGRFDIMVGFNHEGNILNTEVLEHQETPGLGDKIDKKKGKFPVQFVGKHPKNNKLTVKKDGGEIDAITAATITSRAFCNAVINAYNAFQLALENTKTEIVTENNNIEKEENHE